MALTFDRLLGPQERALYVHAERNTVLASNLANADTPGYKARDIDFRAALARELGGSDPVRLAATRPGHIREAAGPGSPEVLYRTPYQPSLDGNTVEPNVEKTKYLENAIRYEASLQFVSKRLKGLLGALRGE